MIHADLRGRMDGFDQMTSMSGTRSSLRHDRASVGFIILRIVHERLQLKLQVSRDCITFSSMHTTKYMP